MNANEYQKLALRTESGMNKQHPRIFNCVLGLAGEAGECADIVKKHFFHGHPLDKEHLKKELGDVAWYLAVCADVIDCTFAEILEMNIAKLEARYPGARFDTEHSLHRNANDI